MPSRLKAYETHRDLPLRVFLIAALMFAAVVSSWISVNQVSAQATTSLASYVPAGAVLYAEFELDQESDQYVQSSALLERANLGALLPEDDEASLNEAVGTLGLVIDGQAAVFVTELPLDDLITTSEMALDATEIGMDPVYAATEEIPSGWAVVLQPSNAEQAFGFYQSLVFGEDVSAITDSAYGGFDILTSTPADEFGTTISMSLVDDVIVIASQADDIHPVIDTVTGDADALDASAEFATIRAAFGADLLSFTYVNGPEMATQLEASAGEEAIAAIEAQGTSFDFHQGVAFWAGTNGYHMDTVSVPVDPSVLPTNPTYDGNLAANVPSDALMFAGGTDLGGNASVQSMAFVIAQEIVAQQTGVDLMATPVTDPEAAATEVFAQAESTIGFNIKTDLLDPMDGEWAFTASVSDIMGDMPEISGLFLAEVSDEAAIGNVLDSLTQQIEADSDPDVIVSSRDANGVTITVITIDDPEIPLAIEYGVVDGKLAIGVNTPLEAVSAAPASSLADDSTFVQTFDALPQENVIAVNYLSLTQLMPIVEDALAATSSGGTLDAHEDCAAYATQEEAQAAYDEDSFTLWNLDQDFDGEACEDFFAVELVATPVAQVTEQVNLLSIGTVNTTDGETMGTSTIILIGG